MALCFFWEHAFALSLLRFLRARHSLSSSAASADRAAVCLSACCRTCATCQPCCTCACLFSALLSWLQSLSYMLLRCCRTAEPTAAASATWLPRQQGPAAAGLLLSRALVCSDLTLPSHHGLCPCHGLWLWPIVKAQSISHKIWLPISAVFCRGLHPPC